MDVINKFYSTVQTTVSQLSGVLPGNNVTREYEILHQVASAGIGLHWKVYSGFKKTTKQEVSIFVFEKKILEKLSKEDRDSLLHLLRRGVQQLTKIKHPRIVTVQHPLEESRDSLAFATEPVIASLSNILEDASTTKLFDVEIIHGFQQLIDGLMFLHCDANIVHGNLSTESVLINKLRNWKIFGLDFSATKHSQNNKFRGLNALSNLLVYPIFEYLAPEKLSSEINIPESDVYSLGMLMYCVCCGRPLMGFDKNHSFKQMSLQPAQLKDADMDKVPHDLRNILKSMLHHKPNSRPKLNELIQLPPFQYIGVKTLNYLDTLYQWNNLEKSKFFKSLLQIIPSFPHQVNIHTVMPHLLNEFANLAMVPFVLPNVLLIAKTSSQEEYSIHILPHIKSAFGIDEPIQVLLILMQELDILLKLTPDSQVKLYILPLLKKSLESDITELQELCLRRLPTLSSLVLDQNSIKNSLIPRIKNLCIKSTDVSIKVKCLICIGKLLEHLDKGVLLSDVLPFFEHIKNREPAIIMAIIGIHRIALNDSKFGITAEIMATKCIPYITPLCMENNLSVAQFTSIATMIKEMFQKIEEEQLIKLEQINTINRDSRIPCNQRSTALSLPGSSCKLLLPSRSALENEKGSILEAKNHTNPLVINRLLMTPAMKALETTHEDYANPNPSINYIYTSHSSLLDHQNVSTQISTANNTKQSNAENSKLIPLTQQDILNFLK